MIWVTVFAPWDINLSTGDAAPVITDNSTIPIMEPVFHGVELEKNGVSKQEDVLVNLDSSTSKVDVETVMKINITILHC